MCGSAGERIFRKISGRAGDGRREEIHRRNVRPLPRRRITEPYSAAAPYPNTLLSLAGLNCVHIRLAGLNCVVSD